MSINTTQTLTRSITTAVITAIFLTGCGGDSREPSTKAAPATTTVAPATLSTTKIDLTNAYTSTPVEAPPTPQCPWLTDAQALEAVNGTVNDQPLQRRRVTPNTCVWNINAGFAVKVESTPLATATALSEVRYNMDVDPVLESVDGPGVNAIVLKDPTWDHEDPRPFAFGFDLAAQRFLITVIGLKTSSERLQNVAHTIAASPARSIAAAPMSVDPTTPTLDPCVYDPKTLIALFDGDAQANFRGEPSMSGSLCEYSGSLQGGLYRIVIGLQFSGDALSDVAARRDRYAAAAEYGGDVFVVNRTGIDGPGYSNRGYRMRRPEGHIAMNVLVSDDTFPEHVVDALVENLLARTE